MMVRFRKYFAAQSRPRFFISKFVCFTPLKVETRSVKSRRSLAASLIPVSSVKMMRRAAQLSDDTDQPWQRRCVRIGTEEVPLDTEELYYNQLRWPY